MKPYLPALALLAFSGAAQASPVTFDFEATGCSGDACIAAQQYPALLATFTLPGPDSSGSAVWAGDQLGFPGGQTPVFTGDSFSLDFSERAPALSPAFVDQGCSELRICDFNLSWSEVGGQLTALSLVVDAFTDSIGRRGRSFGLSGGPIESLGTYLGADGTFQGCGSSECIIAGSWITTAPPAGSAVPEPGSLALLFGSIAGFGALRWRKT